MRLKLSLAAILIAVENKVLAAEAGMPQLDPTYWLSQSFWLVVVFASLYILIARFFVPSIKNNLDDRERKIKDDLDKAQEMKKVSEQKMKEYEDVIFSSKKEVQKIITEAKKKLDKEIQLKKSEIEKQINNEIEKTTSEVEGLKKNSLKTIEKISGDLAHKLIEDITGDKINDSSLKAIVSDSAKKNIRKLL